MKRLLSVLTIWLFTLCSIIAQNEYVRDTLGPGFVQRTIKMPNDYEGAVYSTLIRKTSGLGSWDAVLYVHGYNDYFFQKETASFFTQNGYNFYAVDLRKYGRSLRKKQTPFMVRNLEEYYADLDSALYYIKKEGNKSVVIIGHSTGGLITSLYLDHLDRTSPDSSFVKGLILNSPFLDMNMSWFMKHIAVPSISCIGSIFKDISIPQGDNNLYAKSISKKYKGEWDFNLQWKKDKNQAIPASWIRAIHKGQNKIKRGLNIYQPILVMHSSQSVSGDRWTEEFTRSDAVLNINDIHKYAPRLGKNEKTVIIQDGLHDLALSKPSVRANYYNTIDIWMKKNIKRE